MEDDYFTAVDDLNRGEEDVGAGHVGETEFAAGLFYLYVCIDRDLLLENLQGDEALAKAALASLVEAAATISPTGKQNSFGSRRARIVHPRREGQPATAFALGRLSVAHFDHEEMLGGAIQRLDTTRKNMETVYGPCSEAECTLNAHTGEGSLTDLIKFVAE